MRKLKTTDLCAAIQLVAKHEDLKNEIKETLDSTDTEKLSANDMPLGVDVIWVILNNMSNPKGCELICNFLAGPFECTAKEVEDMEIDELINNLEILVTENNLYDFFAKVKNLWEKMKK